MSETATPRRTSAEIREDIGRTRLGLDFLIEALEGRLSMGGLIDEAVGMLRGRGDGNGPLGALIKEHPGPAALIAAGVVWLAIENRKDANQETRRESRQRRERESEGGRKSSGGRKSRSGGKTGGRKSGGRKTGE